MRGFANILRLIGSPSILIALGTSVVVWLMLVSGALNRPMGWFYDVYVDYSMITRFDPPDVFLAEYDPGTEGDINWARLVDSLTEQGALLVAFPKPPRDADLDFYRMAESNPRVVVGRELVIDGYTGEVTDFTGFPEEVDLPEIIAPPAISTDAVYRRMPLRVSVNDREFETFELEVARRLTGMKYQSANDDFLVNFLPGPGYIPRVDARDVLAGGMIPQLSQGRVALIGPSSFEYSKGLHTPITRGWRGLMSDLEFRAYAIDTISKNAHITVMSSAAALVLMMLAGFASVFIYEWLKLGSALVFTFGVIFVETMIAWVLVSVFNYWIPVAAFIFFQTLVFVTVFSYVQMIEDRALRRMVLETTARIQERLTEGSFYTSEEHWQQVITLVTQVLHLERVIFLERVEGDHRVREIIAHRCELDDIDEMRRDYERTPYSTALEAKGPIVVERTYFAKLVDEEAQYLCPLVFGGEVLGFWAFTIMSEELAEISSFETVVRELGDQIAELLSHRKQWQARVAAEDNIVRQMFELDNPQTIYNSLRRSLNLLEKRIDLTDSVSSHMNSAAILFDAFGHILYVNQAMETWARDRKLPLFDLNALGLLHSATEMDEDKARAQLQHVMLDQGSVRVPVTTSGHGVEAGMALLHIEAVKHEQEWTRLSDTATPFELVGILFEIVDVSEVVALFEKREQLRLRFNKDLRREFDRVRDFARNIVDNAGRRNVDDWIEILSRINHVDAAVGDSIRFTGSSLDSGSGTLPLESARVMRSAIAGVSDLLKPRGISVDFAPPDPSPLILVDEFSLQQSLQSLLELLVEDAIEHTEIFVAIDSHEHEGQLFVRFELRDNGFGIPDERLQSYLDGVGGTESDPFTELRRVRDRARLWGGWLDASSKIGMGLEFKVNLPAYVPGDHTIAAAEATDSPDESDESDEPGTGA